MNNLESKGEIIAVLELKKGTSTKGEWVTQSFVMRETEGDYPKTLCFEVFGQDKLDEFNLKIGDVITLYANIESREWKGKYFTSAKAWKIEKEGSSSYVAPKQQTTKEQPKQVEQYDDESLPF